MQRPTTARTSESSHAPDLRSRISDHILKGRGCFSWAGHCCKCHKYSVLFFDVWIICCFWCSTTLILARKGTSDCKCVAWVRNERNIYAPFSVWEGKILLAGSCSICCLAEMTETLCMQASHASWMSAPSLPLPMWPAPRHLWLTGKGVRNAKEITFVVSVQYRQVDFH